MLKSFALITNKKVEDMAKDKEQVELGGAQVDLIVFDEHMFQGVFEILLYTM